MADVTIGMTADHRRRLRRNLVALVGHLQVNEEFMSYLITNGVLTSIAKPSLDILPRMSDRVQELVLHILPTRGPHAFNTFLKALVYTHQEFLANLLDVEGMLNLAVPTSSLTEVYPVSGMKDRKPYRGRVVILSHQYFNTRQLLERTGNKVDLRALEELFKDLNFDVDIRYDEIDTEIYDFLDQERNNKCHKFADMFLLFILSHGEDGYVYAYNGKKMSIDRIISYFNGENCPGLLGKPKLFFIQACQGARTTTGVDMTDRSAQAARNNTKQQSQHVVNTDSVETDSIGPQDNASATDVDLTDGVARAADDELKLHKIDIDGADAGKFDEVQTDLGYVGDATEGPLEFPSVENLTDIHPDADILIARSTVSGYVAHRHTRRGSFYIQCLVDVFTRRARTTDVLEMLTEVNRSLSLMRGNDGEIQLCDKRDTLNGKVYLVPQSHLRSPSCL